MRALVHRDDERADPLRGLGAEVVVGDLTDPQNVVDAMTGVDRMFFSMSVSPDYLQATVVVCDAALESRRLEVLANMSQMTVSQMTLTSTGESRQHRLHFLAEHVLNWSGVPVVHIRPTTFLDNPIFTLFAVPSLRERNVLALPFGDGPDLADRRQRCRARGFDRFDEPGGAHRGRSYATDPVRKASTSMALTAQLRPRDVPRPITGADNSYTTRGSSEVLKPLGSARAP